MFGLGARELLVLAVILVLLFGTKKIPDLAKGVADAVKILRESFSDDKDKKTDEKK